jgi:hypothetical protein
LQLSHLALHELSLEEAGSVLQQADGGGEGFASLRKSAEAQVGQPFSLVQLETALELILVDGLLSLYVWSHSVDGSFRNSFYVSFR